MVNEAVFLIVTLLDLILILMLFRLGKEGLFAAIVVNLILISCFGAKLISLFGFTTNAGNVFYASMLFALNILLEHYGQKEARRAVWMGFITLVLFTIMGQFVIRWGGIDSTGAVNEAIRILFSSVPRIAFASVLAYLVATNFNIWIYEPMHKKAEDSGLWIRNSVSVLGTQFLDSIIFFSIAFAGILPTPILIQTMIVGFIAKIAVGFVSTPFLYLSYQTKKILEEEKYDL